MSVKQPYDIVTEGVFKGWMIAPDVGNFNSLVGPYYYQSDDRANIKVAFQAQKHHLNAGGSVHGGCLLT
ncbi:MAG: hypothetical protein WBQ60_10310, partial [Asticcacaulis sp.]